MVILVARAKENSREKPSKKSIFNHLTHDIGNIPKVLIIHTYIYIHTVAPWQSNDLSDGDVARGQRDAAVVSSSIKPALLYCLGAN